jgi:branched-chain amino acid transport system ATP-binding protein
MSTAVLETRALSKSFGALRVADDIDFRLEQGARHALIGPNGAGKTTFINLVTGRVLPGAGTVSLEGRDITRLSQNRRVKLGVVRTFQINTLFLGLSVLDNVALALAERDGIAWSLFRPVGHYRRVVEEGHHLLQTLGLDQHAAKLVRELSYGRQRLVEIALGLALRPRSCSWTAWRPSSVGRECHRHDMLFTLPHDISILMIDTTWIWFSVRTQDHVLNQDAFRRGNAAEIAANDVVRAVYTGERALPMA